MALGQAPVRVEVLLCEFSFHQHPYSSLYPISVIDSGPITSRISNRQSHSTAAATTTIIIIITKIMIKFSLFFKRNSALLLMKFHIYWEL